MASHRQNIPSYRSPSGVMDGETACSTARPALASAFVRQPSVYQSGVQHVTRTVKGLAVGPLRALGTINGCLRSSLFDPRLLDVIPNPTWRNNYSKNRRETRGSHWALARSALCRPPWDLPEPLKSL
eukprot:scaffold3342_cov174-Amphora_coffeaeformis.AAC.16